MSDELITREEILTGLPAGRASALLFLIESRTAYLMMQARQAMDVFLTEEAAKECDLACLEAFALGREPLLRPTIQDLERYAPQWAPLVPENPSLRAAVAHLLSQKYCLTCRAVPGIQAALGLDEEVVQQAYHRLYRRPLEEIFAPRPAPLDRLRWAWVALAGWLESLPPFWTAFSLTLTETVGAGILALPIALASVGPLAGVVLLVVLGLVNVLTIAAMAEAVARSGTIRYGSAFIGRVVTDYLGSAGSLILTLGLATICIVVLLVYFVGFSTTLADATRVPAEVWTLLLFLVGLYFLRRESLNATVASALLVGAINIGLILALSLLAFSQVQMENLAHINVPLVGGRPFEPSILQLIFGVVLSAYFGHLSLSNCARVVLRRDPSARSLIWGSMAGMAMAMVLYCIWVLAVNGAIAPQVLASQSGTALAPLAAQIGPSVHVLGSVFVILGMGMGSIHACLGLFNLVRERLPARPRPVLMLPRRRGRLIFHPRGKPGGDLRIGLVYLGLLEVPGGTPQQQFRLDFQLGGGTRRVEITAAGHWEATELFDRFPDLGRQGFRLSLEILDASQESVRLRIDSPMTLTYEGEWDATGLRMADVLVLPDPLRALTNWMMRQGKVSFAEVVAHIGQGEPTARSMLDTLVEQGFVQAVEAGGEVHYRTQLALRRGRRLAEGIWQALEDKRQTTKGEQRPSSLIRLWSLVVRLGERGRFFLSASPVVAVFLLVEWLLFTDAGSFVGPLSFLGVIVVSLLGGIFPVLLLASSRRKGEFVPTVAYRFLGHPLLITSIYLIFLASILVHGLVIWQDPMERAVALFVGVLMLGVTIAMVRRGAFVPRMVVELREDFSPSGKGAEEVEVGEQAVFTIVANGQPETAGVRLGYSEGEQDYRATTGKVPTFPLLRYAIFQLPLGQAQELKVWAHRVTPEGDSEGLPGLLELRCGNKISQFDLKLSGGQVLLPLTSEACQLEIAFPGGG